MALDAGQTIHRVLLVDDDASVLEMMSQSLNSKGSRWSR
jgi:CheY-like chemotaxis protein